MMQVSKDQFYKTLYETKDHIMPSIQPGPWPYTNDWKNRSGVLFGRSVCVWDPAQTTDKCYYFLAG